MPRRAMLLLALVFACRREPSSSPADAPPTPRASQPADAARAAGALTIPGFQTPESVLHDPDADVYLVSNIHGDPFADDDNGFISKVSPDGKILELAWIDGARSDVKLSAPKGLALSGGKLWVTDITRVRVFDARTGEQEKDVPIEGATFLNDVAPDGKGGVFVSDTGVKAGFEPAGTEAIYQIGLDRKPRSIVPRSEGLGAPNGLFAPGDGTVWVVNFGDGDSVYQVDVAKGKKGVRDELPRGQLDGVAGLGDGELLISSWEGSSILRGRPAPGGGKWDEVVTGVKSPADIGWDAKRRRVLIPLFTENTVVVRDLP